MLTPTELKNATTEELKALRSQIFEELKRREEEPEETSLPPEERTGREVVERRTSKGQSLQLEMVKCGKPNCKKDSQGGHGPYYYLYFTNPKTGRYTSRYIGKSLSQELQQEFNVEPT